MGRFHLAGCAGSRLPLISFDRDTPPKQVNLLAGARLRKLVTILGCEFDLLVDTVLFGCIKSRVLFYFKSVLKLFL